MDVVQLNQHAVLRQAPALIAEPPVLVVQRADRLYALIILVGIDIAIGSLIAILVQLALFDIRCPPMGAERGIVGLEDLRHGHARGGDTLWRCLGRVCASPNSAAA